MNPSQPWSRKNLFFLATLTGFWSILILSSLGLSSFTPKGEVREGALAKAMIRTGDWLFPVVNGERLPEKPLLFPWMGASSLVLFGPHRKILTTPEEFALRFPSALMALGVLLLTYWLALLLMDMPSLAFLAALGVAVSPNFFSLAIKARIDMTLTFFTTWTLGLFILGRTTGKGRWYYLSALPMTLAVLAKGPLGFLLPFWIFFFFFLIAPSTKQEIQNKPLDSPPSKISIGNLLSRLKAVFQSYPFFTVLALVILFSSFWYIPAYEKAKSIGLGGEYLNRVLIKENVGMPLGLVNGGGHSHGLFYYLPYYFINFFPLSLFLPLVLVRFWKEKKKAFLGIQGSILLFLVCWAGAGFLFFSIPMGKRPDYLAPLYPAFSILTVYALGFWRRTTDSSSRGERRSRLYRLERGLYITTLGLTFLLLFLMVFPTFCTLYHPKKGYSPSRDKRIGISASLKQSKEVRSNPKNYPSYFLGTKLAPDDQKIFQTLSQTFPHTYRGISLFFGFFILLLGIFLWVTARTTGLCSKAVLLLLVITASLGEVFAAHTYMPLISHLQTSKPFYQRVQAIVQNHPLYNYESEEYDMAFYLNRDIPNLEIHPLQKTLQRSPTTARVSLQQENFYVIVKQEHKDSFLTLFSQRRVIWQATDSRVQKHPKDTLFLFEIR